MAQKMFIPNAIERRIKDLKSEKSGSIQIVRDFGIFIDTHRDQPHVGSFYSDIHRGWCRPTKVDYVIGEDMLLNSEDGKSLQRHDKHLFVEEDWYQNFLMTWLMEKGTLPTNGDGEMPTTHLRDARSRKYLLRSFRQMVIFNLNRP